MADERWRAEAERTAPERGMDDAPPNYDNAEACAWSSGYTAGRREAIDAILRLIERVEPQWLSIETAPKDGTRVLLFNPDEGGFGWAIQTGAYDEELDGWQYDGQNPRYSHAHPPTRWQPLPAPPGAGAASPSGEGQEEEG